LGGLGQGMQDEAPTEALPVLEEVADAAGELDTDPRLTVPDRSTSQRKRPSHQVRIPATAKPLPALYVAADTVLRIANSGQRPNGKPVTADRNRPAGVQVFGASALGIGVRDGDVITRVSGVAVTSPNQIIALVIAARGARAKAISAQVYRGQRSYTLTVEQPYLASANDNPTSADIDRSSQPPPPAR
ncbi:MAG TPA: hypothetical protein VIV60_01580, partial [Polyangiaceae bacterium]